MLTLRRMYSTDGPASTQALTEVRTDCTQEGPEVAGATLSVQAEQRSVYTRTEIPPRPCLKGEQSRERSVLCAA